MTVEPSTELSEQLGKVLEDVFFRPAHWHSAHEVAVQRLAQAIKLGALKAGDRLPPERELVERLGVSRTTLREGMRVLQQQGYVDTRRGRAGGTFVAPNPVRPPTKRDILRIANRESSVVPGLLDLRLAVEPKAAELAAQRCTEQEVDHLRTLVERSEQAPKEHRRQTDSTFHIMIAYAAHSERLLDLVLEEQMRLHDLLWYLAVSPEDLTEHIGYLPVTHRDIVEAVGERDPGLSYKVMKDHIEATNAILVGLLDLEVHGT